MPIHDWTRVSAGIYHHFHLAWIDEIQRALNAGVLPPDCYALAEQQVGKLEPDVLTLHGLEGPHDAPDQPDRGREGGGILVAPHPSRMVAEESEPFFMRKQRVITIRHVSGDKVLAMIEVVSPGNKDSLRAFQLFIEKANWLLDHQIHLLVLDLFPPTPRDPRGIHGAIWGVLSEQEFVPPAGKPLTFVSYEVNKGIRAYIDPLAVGDDLPDMPLFLWPGAHVRVPMEATYGAAFAAVPRRWRSVLDPTEGPGAG